MTYREMLPTDLESVGPEDVHNVRQEQVAEEVGGLARQLRRHVVDRADQDSGTLEFSRRNVLNKFMSGITGV